MSAINSVNNCAVLIDLQVGDEPEWVIENLRRERKHQALQARSALEERLAKAREREARAKQRSEQGEPFAKRAVS